MTTKLTLLLLTFLAFNLIGQGYKVESFQGEYNELKDYNSLQIENQGLCCDKEYEFGFDFPFFDTTYSKIIGDRSMIYSFPNLSGAVRLLGFIYEWDILTNINSIPSDVRYKQVEVDGQKALVIQMTRMRLANDPSVETHDSYISFQYWFFEDGTIDLVFGEMNLENSPSYRPNEGLYLILSDTAAVNIGPEIGITNPSDQDFGVSVAGPYDNLIQNDDFSSRITKFGPEGWVVRFSRLPSATLNISENNVDVYPNPASNLLYFGVSRNSVLSNIEVLNYQGIQLFEKEDLRDATLDISNLGQGNYIWKAILDNRLVSGTFIKM